MTKGDAPENNPNDNKGVTQVIFVLAGLGIIAGGLWSLYMGDAPYHPQDDVTRGDVQLISD